MRIHTSVPHASPGPPKSSGATEAAARAEQLTKTYGSGETRVTALDGVSVAFRQGEFTAIMGPSGSGKSTLMHCLAGLDGFSAGAAYIGGTEISALKDSELTRLRRDRIGFVFQSFNLLPTLDAAENITLPMDIAGRSVDRAWFDEVVEAVGLSQRLSHRPGQLSGGQQQRVAVARALLTRPEIIFADEPTGNLDSKAGREILTLLRDSVHRHGRTVVMVTHDPSAAAYADRAVFFADGRLVDDVATPTADTVPAHMRSSVVGPAADRAAAAEPRTPSIRSTGGGSRRAPAQG